MSRPEENPNIPRGLLHGGEPRPTQEEIAASFAVKRAEHAELVDEDRFLRGLLARHAREPDDGGLVFHSGEACATVRYTTPAGRWRLTLERYG